MYYNNDDIESNPQGWEDAMFDQADAQYERMSQRFNCDSSEDPTIDFYSECCNYRRFEDYEDVIGYDIDEYYDQFCARFDENYYTEECFHQDFGSSSYENWLEMRLWEKNNPKLCKEWLDFRYKHVHNLIPLYCDDFYYNIPDEKWNLELAYNYWKKWLDKSEKERKQLLDEDASYFDSFNCNIGIYYSEWKDYHKWEEENLAIACLVRRTGYLGRYQNSVENSSDLESYEYTIRNFDCWKMWNEKLSIYNEWYNSASSEQKESFENFVPKYTEYVVKNWGLKYHRDSYRDLNDFIGIKKNLDPKVRKVLESCKLDYKGIDWRSQVHLFNRVYSLAPFLRNFRFD